MEDRSVAIGHSVDIVIHTHTFKDRGRRHRDGEHFRQCAVFENGLFGPFWPVDAEAIDGGGDFERPDGLDVGGVEGAIKPGDVRVFEPGKC